MLVDSHCHLDFPDFAADRAGVIARAHAAGVGLMVSISTKIRTFPAVRAIAEENPSVYCSVGVHPHEAESEQDVTTEALVQLADHPKVVAIGETGLDFFYDTAPRDLQAELFRRHIAASRATGLPLVIHTRDADDWTADILTDEMAKGAFPILLHCFSSGQALAETCLKLGAYVSFSGILTFKAAANVRDTAASVPLDRLLVETDAPYLAPVPKRGKTNEPAFVVHTAGVLAGLKGVSPEALAEATTENFFRLFAKVPRTAAQG